MTGGRLQAEAVMTGRLPAEGQRGQQSCVGVCSTEHGLMPQTREAGGNCVSSSPRFNLSLSCLWQAGELPSHW